MTHVDRQVMTRALATAADWEIESAKGESFLTLSSKLMSAYMSTYDVAAKEFAPFAVTAHGNALGNPNALLHKAIDVDTYMESRTIVDPIRLLDCSPLCNGAAALMLASGDVARKAAQGRPRVRIAGSGAATAPLALSRRPDPLRLDAVARSTRVALEQAGVVQDDVDLFELHDAYTIVTVLSLEASGFAAPGKGVYLATEGRIGRDGALPISTMGGLKAEGTLSARPASTNSPRPVYSCAAMRAGTRFRMPRSRWCKISAESLPQPCTHVLLPRNLIGVRSNVSRQGE